MSARVPTVLSYESAAFTVAATAPSVVFPVTTWTDTLGDTEGLTDTLGLTEGLIDGETDGLLDGDIDGLTETLGLTLGDIDADGDALLPEVRLKLSK